MRKILFIDIFCIFALLLSSCTNIQIEESLTQNSIGNLLCGGFVTQSKDKIYFMETKDGKAYLCKSDLKLKKREVVSDTFCQYINVIDDIIYYVGTDRKVYSMDTNGQNVTKIFDVEVKFLYAYNDRLYVIIAGKNRNEFWKEKAYNLVSMNLYGEDICVLCEKNVGGIYLTGDHIYCLYYDSFESVYGPSCLSCFELNGQNDKLILETHNIINCFTISNNFIYFVTDGGTLVKYNMENKQQTLLKSTEIMPIDRTINLNEVFVIYRDIYGVYSYFDFSGETEHRIIDIYDAKDMNLQTEEYFFDTGIYSGNKYLYYYDEGLLKLAETG